jgi:hypothetical protein
LKKQLTGQTVDPNDYSARRSTFDVQVMTPTLKYFIETKDDVEKAENRAKKQKHSDAPPKDPDSDPYTNLRAWRTSLGDFRPVVEIYMLPRLKATGGPFSGQRSRVTPVFCTTDTRAISIERNCSSMARA